jgi:hypothetical protein
MNPSSSREDLAAATTNVSPSTAPSGAVGTTLEMDVVTHVVMAVSTSMMDEKPRLQEKGMGMSYTSPCRRCRVSTVKAFTAGGRGLTTCRWESAADSTGSRAASTMAPPPPPPSRLLESLSTWAMRDTMATVQGTPACTTGTVIVHTLYGFTAPQWNMWGRPSLNLRCGDYGT